jgi:hypothetical protein
MDSLDSSYMPGLVDRIIEAEMVFPQRFADRLDRP